MAISPDAHVKVLTNVGDPLILQDGTPLANVRIKFQLVTFGSTKATSVLDAGTGELVASTPTTVLTDVSGEFTVNLWPNSRGDMPTAYYLTFSNKAIKPFFILIQDILDNTLLTGKAAYAVGTGAVSSDALAALFSPYIPTALDFSYTGTLRYVPTVIVMPPAALQYANESELAFVGKFIFDFLYTESNVVADNITTFGVSDVTGIIVGFSVTDCPGITSISLPELVFVGSSVTLSGCPNIAILTIAKLATVGGIFTLSASALLSFNVPELINVNGALNLTSNTFLTAIDAPKLKSLGSLSIASTNTSVGSVLMPELTTTATSFVLGTTHTTQDFSSLRSVGSMSINNTNITAIDFPALEKCTGAFSITGTALTSLNVPLLVTTGNISISAPNLTAIAFPELLVIAGTLSAITALSVVSVDFSKLVTVTSVFNIPKTAVTAYEFTSLEVLTAAMTVPSSNAILTSLSFPAIEQLQSVSLGAMLPSLTSFTLGATLKLMTSNFSITDGALMSESIDGILVSLAALDGTNGTSAYNGKTITITNQGNAPTATGLAAKAVLEAVGRNCTVTLS